MKRSRVKSALEAIANRGVPDNLDLWPEIEARLRKDELPVRLRTRWSWSLALVLLALALLTTVAYALYRYLNDPGLQAVQEAGLITDVDTTAGASPITPQPAFAQGPGVATMVGEAQTQAGVTVTLDWIYVEDARQAFRITAAGMGPDMRLGMPRVSFSGATPEGYAGATLLVDGEGTITATYLAHQLVRPAGQPGGRVGMQIDVPVRTWNGGQPAPVASFRFEVADVEITVPWGGGGGDSYSVEVNGLEMRMEHAILAPTYTEVRLCYEPPSGEDWVIENASAQLGDAMQLVGEPVAMDASVRVVAEGHQPCEDINFPLGKPLGDVNLVVTAHGLTAPGTASKIDSSWRFSTGVPAGLHIGGIEAEPDALPGPLASTTVGNLTATLEWAYVDSNRMAFTVHFDDWQPDYAVSYIALRLEDGTEVNVGASFQPSESDPATALISLTPATEFKLGRLKGQLIVNLITSRAGGAPTTEFAFDLDLPVLQAVTIEPQLVEAAGGTEVMLQTVRMTPSYTVAYVCYRKPTAEDWMLGDGTVLRIGEDEAGMSEYMMLYDSDYRDSGKQPEPGWKPAITDGRCVRAGFPVGRHAQPEQLVLRIDALQRSTPEVIPEADVKQALDKLRSEGIEMDWMTFTGHGGGGGGPVYKTLPKGMTEDEAYHRFLDALGYVHKGPWVFTVEVNP